MGIYGAEFTLTVIFHPISLEVLFVFNILIKAIIEVLLFSCENSGTENRSDMKLFDLKCANEFVLLNDGTCKVHVFPNHLNRNVSV